MRSVLWGLPLKRSRYTCYQQGGRVKSPRSRGWCKKGRNGMIRGLLSGTILGGFVGGAVLVGANQYLPVIDLNLPEPAAEAVELPAGTEFNSEKPDTEPVLPETETRPEGSSVPLATTAEGEGAVTVDTSSAAVPEASAPETDLTAPTQSDSPEIAVSTDEGVSTEETTAPVVPVQDDTPSETSESLDALKVDEPVTPESGVETDAQEPETNINAPSAETESAEVSAPEADSESPAGSLPTVPETPGFSQPQIVAPDISESEDLPNIGQSEGEGGAETPAIEQFAVGFEPNGGPMVALVLIDLEQNIIAADLAALPFPVTVALNPTHPRASERMQELRGAGLEVVTLAPLPAGATPADVEVSFQEFLRSVPQSVAVLDSSEAVIQQSRPRAVQVVDILAATGHGLITYDAGLNTALQVARAADVPAATVLREFDKGTQNVAAMKRFLDDGAFRAGQSGAEILVGQLRADAIAALVEWSLGSRGQSIQIAPVSAVLTRK